MNCALESRKKLFAMLNATANSGTIANNVVNDNAAARIGNRLSMHPRTTR